MILKSPYIGREWESRARERPKEKTHFNQVQYWTFKYLGQRKYKRDTLAPLYKQCSQVGRVWQKSKEDEEEMQKGSWGGEGKQNVI